MYFFSNIKHFIKEDYSIAKLLEYDLYQFSYKYFLVLNKQNAIIDLYQSFFYLFKLLFFLQLFIKNSGQILFLNNNILFAKFIYNNFFFLFQNLAYNLMQPGIVSNHVLLRKFSINKNFVLIGFNLLLFESTLREFWNFNFPFILLGVSSSKLCRYITYLIPFNTSKVSSIYFFSLFLSLHVKLFIYKYKNIFSFSI